MEMVRKIFTGFRELLKILGAVCLVGMTLVTCADVIGRYLGHPIFGSVEIVGFMATLAAALAMPYTHQMKGHIGVEILVRLFSQRTQAIIEACTNVAALILFAVVSWRMTAYAGTMKRSGEVSMSLEFPEYTIIYLSAFCFVILTLNIVGDLWQNIKLLMGEK